MIMPDASFVAMRPAVLKDLDVLAAIDARCFPAGIAYSKKEIASLLCASTALTMVAERSPTIVGFASLRLLQQRHFSRRAQRGELVTIDVLPEFQREGVGQQLHQALEDWLCARQGSSIELHVAIDNTAALRFYEHLGYRIIERVPQYYLETIDAWRMEKNL